MADCWRSLSTFGGQFLGYLRRRCGSSLKRWQSERSLTTLVLQVSPCHAQCFQPGNTFCCRSRSALHAASTIFYARHALISRAPSSLSVRHPLCVAIPAREAQAPRRSSFSERNPSPRRLCCAADRASERRDAHNKRKRQPGCQFHRCLTGYLLCRRLCLSVTGLRFAGKTPDIYVCLC